MRASRALEVMPLPQVGPTNWTLMPLDGTWNAFSRAASTAWLTFGASWLVVTCHWCGCDRNWAAELPPPALLTTRLMAPWEAVGAVN